MKKIGFTLAEVLITLAIIGVVAAMTIPAVIVNTNQAEFKTGLRKAVSVLNSAITLNKALTGESPYDNGDLYRYLQQHMAILKSNVQTFGAGNSHGANVYNYAFYTADGMRYEFARYYSGYYDFPLYETANAFAKVTTGATGSSHGGVTDSALIGQCGSAGLAHNPDGTTEPPCIIMVDVNGDRKPTAIVSSGHPDGEDSYYAYYQFSYKKADPKGRLLSDIFSIMITDQGAIPYGVVAQKAMYQAQK